MHLAAFDPGLEGLLAQVAAGGGLQKAFDARAGERDDVFAWEFGVFSGTGGGLFLCVRQAVQIALMVEDHAPGLFIRQHVLRELGREFGERVVDRCHALFTGGFELGSGADEPGVIALQEAGLFGVQLQIVAAGEQIGDAFE